MNRSKLILFCLTLLILIAGLYLFYFKTSEPRLILTKTHYSALAKWELDDHREALRAFKNSCTEILKRDASLSFSTLPESGQVSTWQSICLQAKLIDLSDAKNARLFFERWFDPYQAKTQHAKQGLFTGYYLPLLKASLSSSEEYRFPIYGIPYDLIKVAMQLFRADFAKAKPLVGYIDQNRLLPYPDRAAITNGALRNKAPILAWGDSDIDIFFAQIQGSATLLFPDQSKVIISYAGDNGRPYLAIGRILLNKKELDKKNISMQSIRDWLIKHPNERDDIFNTNPSYVFFKLFSGPDPLGSELIPLTPMRSLAVDTHYIGLGIPLWLSTTLPHPAKTIPYNHLVIAQDTGGAIKGVIRGDLYCGSGDEAALIAGKMQNKGRYWLLLPKK